MKREELDRAFAQTPQSFSRRVEDTLQALKEEQPVKKLTMRSALVAVAAVLLLCGIAYAVATMQGQEWYYNNRYTALKEHEPEQYQAIMSSLTTDVPQSVTPDQGGLLAVNVQDYAWVGEKGIFTVSLAARPADDAAYELYPIWNLDADGAWVDELDPENPESRLEHWLWTDKGFGLPKDVMKDPTKRLLLVAFEDDLRIGQTDCVLPGSSYDAFTGEDGAAIFVHQYDLSRADKAVQNAISANTDENGLLTLRARYLVYPFENGALGTPAQGSATFTVKTR